MKPILIALAILLVTRLNTQSAVLAGPIQNPANGHWYYLLDESFWGDAEKEAVRLGGHLATINNAAEQEWI